MTVVRTAETIFYTLINFFPYLMLAMIPFEFKLRFSKKTTYAVVASFAGAQTIFSLLGVFVLDGHGVLNVVRAALDCALYLTIIDAKRGKIMFVFFMLCNVSDFIIVAAEYFEGLLFPQYANEAYRWSFSLIVLTFESVILPLVYLLMNEKVRFAANCGNVKIAWGFMWLIPATFSLVWVSYLYAAVEDASLFRLDAASLLCLFLINLGAFLVYYIVLLLIREQEKSFSLEEHNHALTLQTLQYAKLTEKIREAEHARHDVRHHVSVLTSYLDEGDYDGLKAYLYGYKQAFHDEDRIDFCAYQPINALLSYFSKQAKDNDTKFTVSLRLPKEIGIADNDLSVVIGNLLENAVDACKAQRLGERKIVVGATYDDSTIYFTVDNTFDGEIKKDRHGAFLSTKHSGHGTGTDSVRRIAERYDGIFKTNTKGGIFSASIALRKKTKK